MGKITRLPTELANQIAAGEVVERPASAVKELLENALDASAKRIIVDIEFGGKKLIRVDDDGEGMTPEDAELALERHATSKIGQLDDLGAIATLGFRGEALPSIASVSRLTLRTRLRRARHGTEIRVDSGATVSTQDVGVPEGTSIEVCDLFCNVPARRKFLKSDAAESTQISRVVTQLALGYPEVGFTLRSAGRCLLQCPPVKGFADRFFQIYGERSDLVEVQKTAAGLRVYGYVAALVDQGARRGPQNIFVNGRVVKDRTITHAINEAYSRATIKRRTPEVHLFLEVPLDRIDVNVHPMKAEVRFLEQSLVHEVLRRAMTDALVGDAPPNIALRTGAVDTGKSVSRSIPGLVSEMGATSRWRPAAEILKRPGRMEIADALTGLGDTAAVAITPGPGTMPTAEGAPLIALGQFRDTFIIAVDNEAVVIIDQHVAHERVLFEQVMERLTEGRLESQRLLEPLLLDLPPAQHSGLDSHASDLERLGFEIVSFGGESVRVTAAPSLLKRTECEGAVRALAEDLEGLDRGAGVDEALRRIAATTACHAAVKANDALTIEKMTYLLGELRRTAYSTVCPHGRPVILRLTRLELEKTFQRI
mgnify:CR=1 FL=1